MSIHSADEGNVNKSALQGALEVVRQGEEDIINLEDETIGVVCYRLTVATSGEEKQKKEKKKI